MPYLSEEEASYAGRSIVFGNFIYYRLYSVLAGPEPAECDLKNDWDLSVINGKKIATKNCADASATGVEIGKNALAVAIDNFEQAFNHELIVNKAALIFIKPRHAYIYNHAYLGSIQKINFAIVANSNSDLSELAGEIVSSTAHELYHLGVAHSEYRQPLRNEEENAYIFGECVRYRSVGYLRLSVEQIPVSPDSRLPDSAAQSLKGSHGASQTLLAISGPDRVVSSSGEIIKFQELCNSLTPRGLFPLSP